MGPGAFRTFGRPGRRVRRKTEGRCPPCCHGDASFTRSIFHVWGVVRRSRLGLQSLEQAGEGNVAWKGRDREVLRVRLVRPAHGSNDAGLCASHGAGQTRRGLDAASHQQGSDGRQARDPTAPVAHQRHAQEPDKGQHHRAGKPGKRHSVLVGPIRRRPERKVHTGLEGRRHQARRRVGIAGPQPRRALLRAIFNRQRRRGLAGPDLAGRRKGSHHFNGRRRPDSARPQCQHPYDTDAKASHFQRFPQRPIRLMGVSSIPVSAAFDAALTRSALPADLTDNLKNNPSMTDVKEKMRILFDRF